MLYLSFTFRDSTKEEIEFFSERFSNVYARNPKVKFTTAELHKENYAIFATKEENDETTRILFFLIFDHPLKEFRNIYSLFCAFIKEITHVEPIKENLGKSKRICWNLQEEKYHMYFEEVIYRRGGDWSVSTPHFYKDGLFVQYNYERKAWKEKVNHIDRYYYEQKLRDYSEEEKSPEWYSDYEYAVQLHFCEEDLSEMTHFLTSRNYDRENKKIIPLSNKMLDKIESYCHSIESACNKYNCGSPVWTDFLDKKYKLLKECSSKHYDEIWRMEDLNEPYFAKTKARLAGMFRIIRGLKLPPKGE